MISRKQYPTPGSEDDFDRMANSIFLNILAANHWFQRFYPAAITSASAKGTNIVG